MFRKLPLGNFWVESAGTQVAWARDPILELNHHFLIKKRNCFGNQQVYPSLKRSSRRVFAPENGPGTGRCIHFLLGQNAHFQGVNSLSFRECKLNKNIAWTINISEKKILELNKPSLFGEKKEEKGISSLGGHLFQVSMPTSTFFD